MKFCKKKNNEITSLALSQAMSAGLFLLPLFAPFPSFSIMTVQTERMASQQTKIIIKFMRCRRQKRPNDKIMIKHKGTENRVQTRLGWAAGTHCMAGEAFARRENVQNKEK